MIVYRRVTYVFPLLLECLSYMNFSLGRLYTFHKICETQKTKSVKQGILCHFFLHFAPIFRISQDFVAGSAFTRKVKAFRGLFFCGINKTQNSHEMGKCIASVSYFVTCFAKNTHKMRKVYSRPYKTYFSKL